MMPSAGRMSVTSGCPLGDGTCFVKCYDLNFACFFQRNCCFEKNTVFCAHTVTYHDCNWCGKSQCTWAADNKNRDTSGKRITEFVSCKEPDDGSDDGDTDYRWYKYTRRPYLQFWQ